MYILGSCGSLQSSLLWGWEFLPPSQPPQIFTARSFEAVVLHTGTLGCTVYLAPQLFLPAYPHTNVGPPAATWPAPVFQPPPCCVSSPPLLPVWMSVSSLTPWLLDSFIFWQFWLFFLTCCPFFWLCEEAKCIYLHLHLGQKSWKVLNLMEIIYFIDFIWFVLGTANI